MDVEFHYDMTYLIATKAGLPVGDAAVLAYASQYVDDNDMIIAVSPGTPAAFRNYISQTMNILKPRHKLFRIYPVFHFIPGEPRAISAARKDGKMHWLNTTPNSANAQRMLAAALASADLYRIGIALHGYADTWAHQNFVGYYEAFNSMSGPLAAISPNIGHADAKHRPDEPALVWRDKRLLRERVDNRQRFLAAAVQILEQLMRYNDAQIRDDVIAERRRQLWHDLDWAIGGHDPTNCYAAARHARYRQLSRQPQYGGAPLLDYDPERWFSAAISEEVRALRDRGEAFLARWDPFTDAFHWRDPHAYQHSHWYQFQLAVKQHQYETLAILQEHNLQWLELPEL